MDDTKEDSVGEIEVDLSPTAKDEKTAKPEIVVELEDHRPNHEEVDTASAIDELRKQLASEKAARASAERLANEAAQRAYRAQNDVDDTNLQLIRNAIDTVERNSEILTERYAEAMTSGDYQSAAHIQKDMSSNEAKLLQLHNGREAMERQPKQEAPAPVVNSDPVEALASQLSPRSADWVRKHPECVTDQRMYQKMIAAHQLATAEGYALDSDDYFDSIEGTLKIKQPVAREEDPMAYTAQRRQAPPAAPVSRSAGAPRTMRLSAEEHEMALNMKMKPEEYARQKLKIQQENQGKRK